ncbi:hypothetical protein SAMN05660652_03032 [Propionivibrio dicarboxylicus]|uniref:CopC domain-containing protein n=2 Tax=Propionivibrio dicarboxylicus TaxID=83767 RepID=A0A1G8IM41_9RHOO|nr:hypothetical protein SAMN05660652_03032 [Propionivibrio dicarboxylicus]
MRAITLLIVTASMVSLNSGANAATLINDAEAQLPAAKAIATRSITRGPAIKVIAPDPSIEKIASPFKLHIAFEARGGARIDPASVRMTYLRTPAVDLLERVKPGLSERGIELSSAEVPAGEHQIRVVVQDSEGRETSSIINLNVVK